MKRFISLMFVVLAVCSVQAENWFTKGVYSLQAQVLGDKSKGKEKPVIICEKNVEPTLVSELVQTEVVKDQEFAPGMEVTLEQDMSIIDILSRSQCDNGLIPRTHFIRLNKMSKMADSVKAGTTVWIPSCYQIDSLRLAIDAKSELKPKSPLVVSFITNETMAVDGYWHWQNFGADPFDLNNTATSETVFGLLSMPEDVEDEFTVMIDQGMYEDGVIEYGSIWNEMLSRGGKVCTARNGVLVEIGGGRKTFAAKIYTIERSEGTWIYADPYICHNRMWKFVPRPYTPPPVIETIPTPPDTELVWDPGEPDTIPASTPIPPEKAHGRIQSNLWTGATFPFWRDASFHPEFLNGFLGADFHYYFPRKSFSKPHLGIGTVANLWGGRAYPRVGYWGGEVDAGLQLVVPFVNEIYPVWTIGLYGGAHIGLVEGSGYESRQTTPVMVARTTLNFYPAKWELNLWASYLQGFGAYKLSSWEGQTLGLDVDPATTLSTIGTGVRLFFGSVSEIDTIRQANLKFAFSTVEKKKVYRFGIFSEFHTTFEGLANGRYDEDPAYMLGFGPSFQFPRAGLILSQKNVISWHNENSRNDGYSIGLQLEWAITNKLLGQK